MVQLNVGGTFFTAKLSTLKKQPESKLAALFNEPLEKDSQGWYIINRDGKLFHHILNYLGDDELPPADMAVDVLKEAEYYQVTGLVDWCKAQVKRNEIIEAVELEERRFAGQLLTQEVLAKLARERIRGEGSSLIKNGANGSLVAKVGVVFVGEEFKIGEETVSLVEERRPSRPFDLLSNGIWIGKSEEHYCSIGEHPPVPVGLVVSSDDVINPVVYVQRAMQRFNKANAGSGVQLDLGAVQKRTPGQADVIAHWSRCRQDACRKETLYFCFKYLFHATSGEAGSK